MSRHTALVTGANRGIGLAAATELAHRGLNVVLAARRRADAEEAATEARSRAATGVEIIPIELDLNRRESIDAACADLTRRSCTIDVLVNNAGVYGKGDVLAAPESDFTDALDVQVWGPLLLTRAFVPGMLERDYGRVVNVSSGYGSFAEGLQGPAAYSITKAALDALTVKTAQAVRGNVKVNVMCPGWVRTRMGGAGAHRTPEKGAETIVWLATLGTDGPNGGFFRDRKPIEW